MHPTYASTTCRSQAFQYDRRRSTSRDEGKDLILSRYRQIRYPVPDRTNRTVSLAILDKFEALVNDLSAGLPAELNARRRQYEYYRDKLLTFEEAVA